MERASPHTTSMHGVGTLYASLFLLEESIMDARSTLEPEEYEVFAKEMMVTLDNAMIRINNLRNMLLIKQLNLWEGEYGNVKMV